MKCASCATKRNKAAATMYTRCSREWEKCKMNCFELQGTSLSFAVTIFSFSIWLLPMTSYLQRKGHVFPFFFVAHCDRFLQSAATGIWLTWVASPAFPSTGTPRPNHFWFGSKCRKCFNLPSIYRRSMVAQHTVAHHFVYDESGFG